MSLAGEGLHHSLGGKSLIDDVALRIRSGRVHALLGPNGAGKTTLLKLLAGEVVAEGGTVGLDDTPVHRFTPAALARRRAVLTQGDTLRFPMSVEDVVGLGRLPHAQASSLPQREVVAAALAAVDGQALRGRSYLALSGGERARVRFARVLAQVWEQFERPAADAPRYLLLDEPAAHLDPAYQLLMLRLVRGFADCGGGVMVILHDPNLALLHADDASLLRGGRVVSQGPVATSMDTKSLGALYDLDAEMLRNPVTGLSQFVFRRKAEKPQQPAAS